MRYILLLVSVFLIVNADAQTLFTYGKEKLSAPDFIRAYEKAKTAADPVTPKEYLDLYIVSKLKVLEAKRRGYDTLPQIIGELANLRSQITPAYLNDEEGMNRLMEEAFARSQKDIHIAHIFIAASPDSVAAKKKANEAYTALKKGILDRTNFALAAAKYSDDPAANAQGGSLGFITVFSLPYELETLAYSTPAGQLSALYRSKAGYHIFYNIEERKAVGKMKAAQILLAFPPGATDAEKYALKSKADSLYALISNGADMGKLAENFSNDLVSAASQGMIPEFGVGEFDPQFEARLTSAPVGSVIPPFATTHGWHIVKLISVTPPPSKLEEENRITLREKVEMSDRVLTLRAALLKKVVKLVPHKLSSFIQKDLWSYSDSMFANQGPKGTKAVNSNTVLFTTVKEKTTVADWIGWAQVNRFKKDGSGLKPYPQLWQEFMEHRAMQYYTAHLEDYNPAFKLQLEEFREGNLFFEIMQREVWEKAQMDTVALKNYFTKNRQRYSWKKSADAVIFFANDVETANEAREALKSKSWKQVATDFTNRMIADSGRFEQDQVPHAQNTTLENGQITATVTNPDQSIAFAYVLKVYNQPEPRSYEEAKGLVINDYQAELDKAWTAALRKKYPVVIDQKVWTQVLKKIK